jgi:hypothetical protein
MQIAVATFPGMKTQAPTVNYASAQTAGDLNVIAVGWNDSTSVVSTVKDTLNNTYTLAVGPTRYPPDCSESIYYAPGIHAAGAGVNTVTVTFAAAANVVDLRALEYSGLDPVAPFDVAAAAQGMSSTPASSGPATTQYARELLFGAGMSTFQFSNSGTNFTNRVVTTLGDIAEDQIVSTTGSYSATAPLVQNCGWVMQLAAFH